MCQHHLIECRCSHSRLLEAPCDACDSPLVIELCPLYNFNVLRVSELCSKDGSYCRRGPWGKELDNLNNKLDQAEVYEYRATDAPELSRFDQWVPASTVRRLRRRQMVMSDLVTLHIFSQQHALILKMALEMIRKIRQIMELVQQQSRSPWLPFDTCAFEVCQIRVTRNPTDLLQLDENSVDQTNIGTGPVPDASYSVPKEPATLQPRLDHDIEAVKVAYTPIHDHRQIAPKPVPTQVLKTPVKTAHGASAIKDSPTKPRTPANKSTALTTPGSKTDNPSATTSPWSIDLNRHICARQTRSRTRHQHSTSEATVDISALQNSAKRSSDKGPYYEYDYPYTSHRRFGANNLYTSDTASLLQYHRSLALHAVSKGALLDTKTMEVHDDESRSSTPRAKTNVDVSFTTQADPADLLLDAPEKEPSPAASSPLSSCHDKTILQMDMTDMEW